MSEKKETVGLFVDYCNEEIELYTKWKKRLLEMIGEPSPAPVTNGPYKQATGPKGEFWVRDDVESDEYKNLLADLKSHNGRMRKDVYFYWILKDGKAIGRKKV